MCLCPLSSAIVRLSFVASVRASWRHRATSPWANVALEDQSSYPRVVAHEGVREGRREGTICRRGVADTKLSKAIPIAEKKEQRL